MSYKRDGDTVTLEISGDDYNALMFALGFALAGMTDPDTRHPVLAMLNRLNEGNPSYTPFGVPDKYRDATFPERACDRCGALYCGPAVYCSLKCAMEDA